MRLAGCSELCSGCPAPCSLCSALCSALLCSALHCSALSCSSIKLACANTAPFARTKGAARNSVHQPVGRWYTVSELEKSKQLLARQLLLVKESADRVGQRDTKRNRNTLSGTTASGRLHWGFAVRRRSRQPPPFVSVRDLEVAAKKRRGFARLGELQPGAGRAGRGDPKTLRFYASKEVWLSSKKMRQMSLGCTTQ
jgi:hypothetical protein